MPRITLKALPEDRWEARLTEGDAVPGELKERYWDAGKGCYVIGWRVLLKLLCRGGKPWNGPVPKELMV